jgi:polyisoprenyl-teichoic acid--peptidoglycan teichoic acid transferase
MRGVLLACLLFIALPIWAQEATAPAIPEAMPLIDEGGQDILNILLVGSATHNDSSAGLTDSMLVLSFNTTTRHTAIVSLPRDLYVYMPHFGMGKLNQAYFYGEKDLTDGIDGITSLKETIAYNLGLQIDYYARVNFNGFQRLIDTLGGVEISVDCVIRDWRLKSPELDKQVADNYELFTLEAGVYTMNGDTALWYVRSRKTSNDLDRGRRQQDMLRAVWRKIRQNGLLESFPQLWQQFGDIVQTDMTLDNAVSLLPSVIDLDTSDISYYNFRINHEVTNGYTPDDEQRFILIPNREAVFSLMQNVVYPPTSNQVTQTRPTVALINATGTSFYDYLVRIAADRLELEGFKTEIWQEATSRRNFNRIVDYTGIAKGNPVERIMDVLATTAEGVAFEPDANRAVDYKIFIGANYQFFACTRPVLQPTPEPEATATP